MGRFPSAIKKIPNNFRVSPFAPIRVIGYVDDLIIKTIATLNLELKMAQKHQQDFSGTIRIDEMAGDLCGDHSGFTGRIDCLGRQFFAT